MDYDIVFKKEKYLEAQDIHRHYLQVVSPPSIARVPD